MMAVGSGSGSGSGRYSHELARLDRRVFAVAMAPAILLIAFSAPYGFHRDELYFLDCGRHLALSYVDQPVFTPLVARLSLDLFGVSVVGLRLFAAVAAFATVVCGGLLAREFGGGVRAQLLSAAGCAVSPALLGADHLFGPTAFDILSWAALAVVVVRIGRTSDCRYWLAAGLVLGVGLTNKHSIGFFATALVVGTLASGGWRLVFNWWFGLGLVVAVAFTVPDLWWQSQHGWATVAMTRALNQENGGIGNAPGFLVQQAIMASPVLIPVWWRGLKVMWGSERAPWRGLAWAYGLLVVFFAVTSGAKPYYVAGMYIYLVPAGLVSLDAEISAGRVAGVRPRLVWLAVGMLVTIPLTLPVLPARDIRFTAAVNPVLTETVGWEDLVGQVRQAWFSLTPSQRATGVIFTSNYGEEGAINELGRRSGLPEAVGDHNNDWWWGPGNPEAQVVLAVGPGPEDTTDYDTYLRRYFGSVQQLATLTNPYHLKNQEYGGHIYLCTEPDRPWGQMWPKLRHYE